MVRGSVSVHHHQFDLGECHGVKEQFFIENNLYMKKMLFKLLHCIVKEFIIKFPYNARSDWLKQRPLSGNKVQVNDIKLASKFLLRNFDKFDPN